MVHGPSVLTQESSCITIEHDFTSPANFPAHDVPRAGHAGKPRDSSRNWPAQEAKAPRPVKPLLRRPQTQGVLRDRTLPRGGGNPNADRVRLEVGRQVADKGRDRTNALRARVW